VRAGPPKAPISPPTGSLEVSVVAEVMEPVDDAGSAEGQQLGRALR